MPRKAKHIKNNIFEEHPNILTKFPTPRFSSAIQAWGLQRRFATDGRPHHLHAHIHHFLWLAWEARCIPAQGTQIQAPRGEVYRGTAAVAD